MPQKVNPFTKQDLYIQFKRDRGMYPDNLENYIEWLEEKLLKHIKLKRELLPWEPLK